MHSIFMVAGGLGLFLFGMKIMSDGLEKIAGNKIRLILKKATSNRFFSVLIGIFFTTVVHSSSAAIIMVISFTNAGLISLMQAIGVTLGANVGTTISTQLIAFNIDSFTPLFIFIGSIIVLFFKNDRFKNIGYTTLGFGLLFFGITVMGMPLEEFSETLYFQEIITSLKNPFLAFCAGLILTAIIQSSSAIMGILIAISSSGAAFPFEIAAFIILGSNIGTCLDTMLASIPANRDAKRVAVAHFLYNIITCIFFAMLLIIFPEILLWFQNTWGNEARQIAMFHTIFNIGALLLFIPFIGLYTNLILKMIPIKFSERKKLNLKN